MIRDPRFPIRRGGGIICPQCNRVVVVAAHKDVLPIAEEELRWCHCGWAEREYPGNDDNEYKRVFEIIFAGDDE